MVTQLLISYKADRTHVCYDRFCKSSEVLPDYRDIEVSMDYLTTILDFMPLIAKFVGFHPTLTLEKTAQSIGITQVYSFAID